MTPWTMTLRLSSSISTYWVWRPHFGEEVHGGAAAWSGDVSAGGLQPELDLRVAK